MSVGATITLINQVINTAGDTAGPFEYGIDYAGAYFILTISGLAATFSITDLKIQTTNDGGTTWFNVQDWGSLALNANGTSLFCLYPGATATGGLKAAAVSLPLPQQWRAVVTTTVTGGSATVALVAMLQP
jgi:hypothetical protein